MNQIASAISRAVVIAGILGVVVWSFTNLAKTPDLGTKGEWAYAASQFMLVLVFGYGAVWIGRAIRLYQERESAARAALSLNVNVIPRAFKAGRSYVLEVIVEVRNMSRDTWCVPLCYVSARPLLEVECPSERASAITDRTRTRTRFDDLDELLPLSTQYNCALLPESIIQVAPDEVETFVRWEVLSETDVHRYPVLVVNCELFGASGQLLGEMHIPKHNLGPFRNKWLDLVNVDGFGRDYILVRRWARGSAPSDFKERARHIVGRDGTVDLVRSRDLKQVLESIVQWTRHVTVDIRGATEVPVRGVAEQV
jgi:hypothetical protein